MTEQELLDSGYRRYKGSELNVYYNIEICEHSRNCVNGNSEVFDSHRRPWVIVDNASPQEVKRVIHQCPSGALKYKTRESPEIQPEHKPAQSSESGDR